MNRSPDMGLPQHPLGAIADKNLGGPGRRHPFEFSTTRIGIRRNAFLRGYVYAFIELFASALTRRVVEASIAGGGTDVGL